MAQNFFELANFIWSVADLLLGDYKQAGYGKVAGQLDINIFKVAA